MSVLVQLIFLPLPWFIRRIVYKNFYGYDLKKNSYIGRSLLINVTKVSMARGSRIGDFNMIRNLEHLDLGSNAIIGTFNWIAGTASNSKGNIQKFSDHRSVLELGDESAIVARHIIDCADAITIGRFSIIAGHRSQMLTHSIDFQKNIQSSAPISIGSYCFVGTGVILLKGSSLPDRTVLGAGSVVTKKFTQTNCIYGGIPAKKIKAIDGEYKYFDRIDGFVK